MRLLASAAIAISSAAGASAFGFEGADLSYMYHLYGELELGRYNSDFSDYDRMTVTVGYEIGRGATFERRDHYEVWQGY